MKESSAGVSVAERDGAIAVSGALTLSTASKALDAMNGMAANAAGRIVVDLADVGRCDSAALAVLLEWQRRATRSGRELVYRNIPARLIQLARISELDTVLAVTA